MRTPKPDSAEQYFNEALTWETDRVQQSKKAERRAWVVACVACLLTSIMGVSLSFLLPLKTVEPFVIRVDNATGIVDVVNALKDGKTNYDEAVNKYFLNKYVLYREGYSKDLVEEYYNAVGLMSDPLEQQKYYEAFNPKNPRSPINVLGAFAKIRISVKSISFLKPDVASVRYMRTIERGVDRSDVTHWVATIGFKYTGMPMKDMDRFVNPLGFQETEYRNDPDALHDQPAHLDSLPNFSNSAITK